MTAPKPLPRVDYVNPSDADARAAYAVGLRHLADLIADGTSPLPSGSPALSLFVPSSVDDKAAYAATLRRALGGGKWTKRTNSDDSYLMLEGMCAGLPVDVWVSREAVCEKVVVGTEKVAVPARPETILPAVEAHTETREVVEWRCSPLLAADEPAEVPA